MKLLLENWRQYLAEDEAQHFPWLKEIQATDDLKEIQAIVNSDRFKEAGGGSFRKVYQPVDGPAYVIKVIHEDYKFKKKMNKEDFEAAVAYPLIFPKAYAHGPDWKWVVLENVEPLVEPEDMQKVLDKSFAAEQKAILQSWEDVAKGTLLSSLNIADPFHLMRVIMSSFRASRDEAPAHAGERAGGLGIAAASQQSARVRSHVAMVAAAHLADERDAALVQGIVAPVAGAVYQELSKAMQSFAIDKDEIGVGNIGYDKGYNFKIIDSSIFEDESDVGW
tara:strand:- start:2074 stop:2907 length:834 start_codon:yes stop_codon:yes gene_type:complete